MPFAWFAPPGFWPWKLLGPLPCYRQLEDTLLGFRIRGPFGGAFGHMYTGTPVNTETMLHGFAFVVASAVGFLAPSPAKNHVGKETGNPGNGGTGGLAISCQQWRLALYTRKPGNMLASEPGNR